MSASPSGPQMGRTPNGGPPPVIRRPKVADPLVRPKPKKRPPPPGQANGIPHLQNLDPTNPAHGKPPTRTVQLPPGATRPTTNSSNPLSNGVHTAGVTTSGFSQVPTGPYKDYPLVTTKRALMEGLRYHVARFASKKPVDPSDEKVFTRPVRLHRRDPRAPPAGAGGAKDESGEMGATDSKDGLLDDKERERQDILRAERDAQREADLAQIAPSANTGGQKKANAFKKKTQQVYRNDQTDEQKAASNLRYEEALPWHLEDFDNKNTWVGSYEAALSDTYAMMVLGQDGKYRMIPLEKWYKFTSKNHFKPLTTEEAEMRMGKKVKEPRWFMESRKAHEDREAEQKQKKATSKLYLGKWESPSAGGVTAPAAKNEQADADDLDFEEDRFADDEENQLFEGEDDDTKQAEDRIKRDQLQANVFDLKEEKEYEKAELREKKEKEAEKLLGKQVKKALMKREKNYIYDTDSADNPYSETSESDDTETERLKEEERKKEEEKKGAIEKDRSQRKNSGDLPSGASTKGTSTPSGRPKHSDPLKKSTTNSLKRPGSPNLSEASGTESTRKKHKKKHGLSSSQPTGTSTPIPPGSRPRSPAPPPSSAPEQPSSSRPHLSTTARKPSIVKPSHEPSKPTDLSSTTTTTTTSKPPSKNEHKRPRPNASSDGEATAPGSGAEMSDGSNRKKKPKLRLSGPSANGTPQGSRAGSPVPPAARAGQHGPGAGNRSRAGSPGVPPPAKRKPPPPFPTQAPALSPSPTATGKMTTALTNATLVPPPTATEIIASIPHDGTDISALIARFKGRIRDNAGFIALVKANSIYGDDKKLRPKPK